LNNDEYAALSKKLWGIQQHKCFICEEDIDLELNKTDIDHIEPLAKKGLATEKLA